MLYERLDAFGAPAQLRVRRKERFSTLAGALYTVFAVLIVALFTLWWINELTHDHGSDPTFKTERLNDRAAMLRNNFTVGGELNVAFGFSDEHDQNTIVEDPLYGTMQAIRVTRFTDGTFQYDRVPTSPCENLDNFPPVIDKHQ